MKFKIITLFMAASAIFLVFSSNSNGRASQGPGYGNTGAPGDETAGGQPRTCQGCHSGPISMTQAISVYELGTQTPVTTYVPGTVYDVVVLNTPTAGSPTGYGFQIVCLKSDNTDVAAWSNPAANAKIRTATTTGRSYAEQNGTSNTNSFRVSWTAPTAGTGTVTFYASGTAVNRNNTSNGDGANRTTLQLPENTNVGLDPVSVSERRLVCFPNPAQHELTLRTSGFRAGEYPLAVYDLMGRVQFVQNVVLSENAPTISVSLAKLPAGAYMVRLGADAASETALFIKQ
jgi:hypothetical protein